MTPLDDNLVDLVQTATGARNVVPADCIQELWGGYGRIQRLALSGSSLDSVILKLIDLRSRGEHPRGWDTDASHERKRRSYVVEARWYLDYAARCTEDCPVPGKIAVLEEVTTTALVLEDLNHDFPRRSDRLSVEECALGLRWLAAFHARFLHNDGAGLWPRGCYWHLATRQDEWAAMADSALKDSAAALDDALDSAQFKTLVHGDAKVANFCFDSAMTRCAAVDFQYVGRGCGVQDVAYFLGSALNDDACRQHEAALLQVYFDTLHLALRKVGQGAAGDAIEDEWRALYPVAWADFLRFMLGWMPTHHKVSPYAYEMSTRALEYLCAKH